MSDDDNADANALQNGAVAAAFPPRMERGASSINVRDFHPDQDDFEQWVKLFEKAVKMATNVRDDATLLNLYLEWLPLKLQATAYVTYRQATKTTWPALKEELIGLFIDPQERYKWQAKYTTIKWDGKESFHNLAARVVQAVNRYDKEMPDEYKKREYFFRFRNAFKKPMRRIIDMGCPANNRTLEMAKEVALRYQLSTADDNDNAIEGDVSKDVAFANANLHPDRATSLEDAMEGITTRLDNLSVSVRRINDRLDRLDSRLSAVERAQHQRSHNDGYQSNSRLHINNRNDRRNDDRRNDDRRNDDRRNDDRRNNVRRNNVRRNNDCRNNDCRNNDCRDNDCRDNDRRDNDHRDQNDQRNQYRDNHRNTRDNDDHGRNNRPDWNDQYQDSETADDSEDSTDDEPQGAAGHSRRN